MASTLACIGLGVDSLETLNEHLGAMAVSVAGRVDGIESIRYADDSGARVVVVRDADGETLDLKPSYDAAAGALVGDLGPFGSLAQADVLGEDQDLVTRFAVDLEQHRHLGGVVAGPLRASVVALGVEMGVHADAAAFTASDASLLGDASPGEEAARWGEESFVSYGLFATDGDPEPTAFLAGTVVASRTETHGATGQDFHVVRVRSTGFEATVCLAASEHPDLPVVGNVVAGSCYLVVDVPTLWTLEPPRRRRRGR